MNGECHTDNEASLKILLLGDPGCGKTSLLKALTNKTFNEVYTQTVFDHYTAYVNVEGKKRIKQSLWDTSGSPDYDHVRPLSYKDTDVFVLCFDISTPDSLANVKNKWLPEVFENSTGKPFVLVGCKADLREDSKTLQQLSLSGISPITSTQGLQVSTEIGATDYFECSSKAMDDNIEEIFAAAARVKFGNSKNAKGKRKNSSKEQKAAKRSCHCNML